MNKGMVRCPECGEWFFDWKKLKNHLIDEHGYTIELPDEGAETTDKEVSNAKDVELGQIH